ncbi:MAG: hypothetical protein AAF633_00295 [Chloroflexota bacterium]
MSQIACVNNKGQFDLINADGSGLKRITDQQFAYQFPAWSPDGQSIAAIGRSLNSSSPAEGYIIVVDDNDDGPQSRILYRSQDQIPFYLYWSPDSRYISFLATHPKSGMALHYLSASGGMSHLLHVGQPFFWMWHPNATEMLIHTGGADTNAELSFLKPNNNYEGLAINLASPGFFQTPGISPSFGYVSFGTQDDSGRTEIVIESKRSRKRKRFGHKGAAVMSWSPTHDYLAYISPINNNNNFYGMLRLVEAETGRRVVLVEETVLAFFWSPDGEKIAYFTLVEPVRSPEYNVQATVSDGYAKGRPMPSDISYTLWLNLNVVNVYTGEHRLLTPFKPNAIFVNQFMPFFDQYALSHRLWSPNSDAILLPAVVNDEERIVIVPVNGMPPIDLHPGTMASWSHA